MRVRPRQVPRAWRIRSSLPAVLPGGHRSWLSRVEARVESTVSARKHRLPRTSRDDWKAIQRFVYPGRSEEELRTVCLEEHTRVATARFAFLLRLGECDHELVLR